MIDRLVKAYGAVLIPSSSGQSFNTLQILDGPYKDVLIPSSSGQSFNNGGGWVADTARS